jgi:hypothetical protein
VPRTPQLTRAVYRARPSTLNELGLASGQLRVHYSAPSWPVAVVVLLLRF